MVAADPSRVIEVLARREDLLSTLEEQPMEKRRLVDTLAVSRSTVDRAVRRLESVGMVRRDSGVVRLTLAGRLALARYESYRESLAGLGNAWPFLGPVPPDADLSLDLFGEATTVPAERYAPHQPVQVLKTMLRGADRIRGVVTAVLPEYVDLYHRLIVEEATTVELVVATPVLSELVQNFASELRACLETGRLQIREVTESPPFSTVIATDQEPEIAVVVYGDRGTTGLIRNDTEAAIEWGRSWIRDWESRADPIDLEMATDSIQ